MDDIINEIDSIKSRGVTMREIIAALNSIDVHLYLGHDDCIYNLVGEESAMGRESDIKLLYERRKMLKKTHFDNIKQERKDKEENPF